jgi:hypothetical protein
VQLELGGNLLEELLDALLLERIEDNQSITRTDEELQIFEKIGCCQGHSR